MKINLNLDYKLKPAERRDFPHNKYVTEHLVRTFAVLRYPQGMNRTDTRTWSNIMDALDGAIQKDGPDEIEIEKSEFLWILDVFNWCLDNSKVPPLMASLTILFVNYLEKLKTHSETKLEAVK